jgi:hypothetical protein
MHAMATKKIIKAAVGYKGTSLKALLILEEDRKLCSNLSGCYS